MTAADLIPTLAFSARPHASGAIELSWALPGGQEGTRVRIVRRRFRFPASPAPYAPVDGGQDHLGDGWPVYDSAAFTADRVESGPIDWQDGTGIQTDLEYRAVGPPGDPAYEPLRRIVRLYRLSPVTGDPELVSTTFTFRDSDGRESPNAPAAPLRPGERYYYTAFLDATLTFSRRSQASAPATIRFGLGKALYEMLPGAYQRHDTVLPDPGRAARGDRYLGQLRRFMETLGGELDVVRTLAEGLRDLKDPDRVPADLLPVLAAMIGWDLSRFVDESVQRREVGLAPLVFRTAGTIPTIRALVNLYTGWRAEVREMSTRIFTAFDRDAVERHKGKRWYHGPLGRSLVLGPKMNPNLPTQVRNRPIDDPNHYTYEMNRPNYSARYSMEAVGLWLYPNQDDQALVLRRGQQLMDALQRYLPAHVRVVLFIEMVVPQEKYDAQAWIGEALQDTVADLQTETVAAAADTGFSQVTGWLVIRSNQGACRSVSIAGATATGQTNRVWHPALGRWI
jgi:phage tail-like protein